MAYLREDKRTGNWFVCYRFGGNQFSRSCGTNLRKDADIVRVRIDDAIVLVRTGRLAVPTNADIGDWLFRGGKAPDPRLVNGQQTALLSQLGLAVVCRDYLLDQAKKAENTIAGEKIHIRHLQKFFGKKRKLETIQLADLKRYFQSRQNRKYRGRPIGGTTIKKELATFRQIWVWAQRNGLVQQACPLLGPDGRWEVRIPKSAERIKFQTWRQIERRIGRRDMSDDEQRPLWASLFLDQNQVSELLTFVEAANAAPFVYPMFAFAAYTGARRSEICRSEIDDFDFDESLIQIRERKRRKDLASTTRFVPMHPNLRAIMTDWFDRHPGGSATLSSGAEGHLPVGVTPNIASKQFRAALKGSKWQVVRGFHVLRHSFGSNLARTGKVSSEEIGKWMGHSTDEMRELYQHLFPQDGVDKIRLLC